MASNTTFFSPADPLDLNTLLGIDTASPLCWIVQTNAPSGTQDRASGLGQDGDEIAHVEYNAKSSASLTYKCYAASGTLKLPSVGEISGGYHIDSVGLAYSPTDWPTLTIAAHRHDGTTGTHAAGSCRTYSPTLVFPAQFCIPHELRAEDATVMFKMSATGVAMRTLSYGLSCTHVDETGSCGDWIAGDNHDGTETLDAEFTGYPDGPDLVVNPAWSKTSDGISEGNTAVNSRTISLTRHLAHD
jgi:hypothetical protein